MAETWAVWIFNPYPTRTKEKDLEESRSFFLSLIGVFIGELVTLALMPIRNVTVKY